jgi:hypothetical protein
MGAIREVFGSMTSAPSLITKLTMESLTHELTMKPL